VVSVALTNSIFLDRLETTGVLTGGNARALGGVGPAARASGVAADVRLDHPDAGYAGLTRFQVPIHTAGDVMARFTQRLDEIPLSFDLLAEAFQNLPEGPLTAPVPDIPAGTWGLGASESPRGENLVLLRFGDGNRLTRNAIRTASYVNWPLIPTVIRGNIVPDFPLINKSFELCYADVDR